MHYYKKNIGDYRGATSHLSLLEHGVYGWLLDTYYMDEQPLPLDERQLFRIALARNDEEKQAVRDVLDEFFEKTEKGWMHNRCEMEIKAFHAKAEANRKNGSKGGRPSKENPNQNPQETQSVNSENPQETLTNNHKPLTNNHEPITSNQYIYTFDLEFVNVNLLKAGRKMVDQKYIDELQPQFELYYADQHMTNNRALVKFVQWIMRNQDKPQPQSNSQNNAWAEYNQRVGEQFSQGEIVDVTPKKSVLIEEVGHA